MKNILMNIRKHLPALGYIGAATSLCLFSGGAFAADDQDLGSIAQTVRSSMGDVAALITAAAYVAGIGFAMMGLLKLKAHKDNPTQVPLSQPLTLLIIAAGLVFMPSLIKTAGSTIWTGKEASGTLGGTSAEGEEHGTFGTGQ